MSDLTLLQQIYERNFYWDKTVDLLTGQGVASIPKVYHLGFRDVAEQDILDLVAKGLVTEQPSVSDEYGLHGYYVLTPEAIKQVQDSQTVELSWRTPDQLDVHTASTLDELLEGLRRDYGDMWIGDARYTGIHVTITTQYKPV